MGRSFKYHRPRGVLTAGSEEPNALMQVGTGASMIPNVRATVQEIYPGLEAQSQNRLGPLERRPDGGQRPCCGRSLAPGSNYKTFMWPRGFWEKVYEPIIPVAPPGWAGSRPRRRRTGTKKAFAFCDVLVIGGGGGARPA